MKKYHLINDKVVLADSLTVEQGQYEFDIRCKFNSQYYGVKVFTLFEGTIVKLTNIDTRIALLLREVSDLTDEEREVLRVMLYIPLSYTITFREKGDFIVYKANGEYYPTYLNEGYPIAQYLLRIGILLPFTYLNSNKQPITLSTEDIIKLGWAVTKSKQL